MRTLIVIFVSIILFTSCVSNKLVSNSEKPKKEKRITHRGNKKFTRKFMKNLVKTLTKEEIDIINNTNVIFEYKTK
jgi:hypothetical protein